MIEGTRGTAINCIDGRVQVPVIEYLKERYDLDHIDMVTEPGPDLLFSGGGQPDRAERALADVELSRDSNGSQLLAIAGHHDCKGNPVDEESHRRQIGESVEVLRGRLGGKMTIVGLWVDGGGRVHEVG